MLGVLAVLPALLTPEALSSAHTVVAHAFPSTAYAERLMVGRRAQLGDEMIYRPGSIGCTVDSALTYGEYDLDFFAALVDRALEGMDDSRPRIFVDVGSGVGRLVLAAAELWPPGQLVLCAGVERVPELHRMAVAALDCLPSASRCSFFCGDASEVLAPGGPLAEASVLFAYSSTWPSQGDELTDFSATFGTVLRAGTRVITTDRKLCSVPGLWEFALLDSLEGPNMETGGRSIGFVYEVTRSRLKDQRSHSIMSNF